MKVLAVGSPLMDGSGGERRGFFTLSHYKDLGVESLLHFPFMRLIWILANYERKPELLNQLRRSVDLLERNDVRIQSMFRSLIDKPQLIFNDRLTRKLIGERHPYPYWFFLNLVGADSPLHQKYIATTLNESRGYDLVYQLGEPLDFGKESLRISKMSGIPMAVLILEHPYKNKSTIYYLTSFFTSFNYVIRPLFWEFVSMPFSYAFYSRITHEDSLRGVAVISQASFQDRKISRDLQKSGKLWVTLNPSNAIEAVDATREYEKGGYAIFYARMVPEKGIFELFDIVRRLDPTQKVLIYGKFPNDRMKRDFMKLLQRFPNMEYNGFASRDDLLDSVRKAKVLIYPSHADAFSLGMFEAITLGTSVVAYDIPGLSIYRGLPVVKLVDEFDHLSMAREVKKFLDMPQTEYESLHRQEVVRQFIRDHDSWRKAAQEEIEKLNYFLKSENLSTFHAEPQVKV